MYFMGNLLFTPGSDLSNCEILLTILPNYCVRFPPPAVSSIPNHCIFALAPLRKLPNYGQNSPPSNPGVAIPPQHSTLAIPNSGEENRALFAVPTAPKKITSVKKEILNRFFVTSAASFLT
jgi:hypothetical protein